MKQLYQKLNKYLLSLAPLTVIIVLIFILSKSTCVRQDEVVVNKATYDSLVAIANRPPRVDTIIHVDTVLGKPIIKWKDKLVPVYKDSLTTVYKDTLSTKYFKVITTDSIQWNELKYRAQEYESYPRDTTITIEVPKPIFVPVDKPVPQNGFYYGATVGAYINGAILSGDIIFVSKKESYAKLSVGGIGDTPSSKIYPIIQFGMGKRF